MYRVYNGESVHCNAWTDKKITPSLAAPFFACHAPGESLLYDGKLSRGGAVDIINWGQEVRRD